MKTGIFYGYSAGKTLGVAKRIIDEFGSGQIESNNVEEIISEKFMSYDLIILGASTWFDGELPSYWDEFLPELENANLTGKKIAIFGLGNQKGYPDNFGDAVGVFAQIFEDKNAQLIGFTNTEGYDFEESKALRGEKFSGLLIDEDIQAELTEGRVKSWVKQIKEEIK
ncbi:MAG: flavodoxin [Bacteroidota bacterium]